MRILALRLEKSFKKFYGRNQDLIEKYQMVHELYNPQDNPYFTYGSVLVILVFYKNLSLGFVDTLFDC